MASPLFTSSLRASACHIPSSSASSSLVRCFASTPSAAAKAAAKPLQKKRTGLKKNAPSGPRSTGAKRRSGGDSAASSNIALTTPFYRPPPDMSDMPTLAPEEANQRSLNQIMAFSRPCMDTFNTFGLERKVQNALGSHIRPCSLVRKSTLDLYSSLAASTSAPKKVALTGPLSGGKSFLMLQAVSYALASEWLVVYVPQLVNFINSTSSYEYSAEEQAWLQPNLLQKFFRAVLDVNKNTLKKIKVNDGKGTSEIRLDRESSVSTSTSLEELLVLATTRKQLTALTSQHIFDLFLSSIQSQSSVPVLLALDHLQTLYLPSRYRTPDYEAIQSYELGPVRSLVQLVAGQKGLQSGMILGALSHYSSTYPVPKEVKTIFNQALAHDPSKTGTSSSTRSLLDATELHPYDNVHPLHLKHVKASAWSPFDVPDSWSEAELRALFELRRRQGRNWNGGNSIAEQVRSSSSPFDTKAANDVTAATQSDDELFFLRVMESGRNPDKFDKGLWGNSVL